MTTQLKRKYRVGPDDSKHRDKPWRGGRGGMGGSGTSGKARSKGLDHPIGMSGRTAGGLVRNFRTTK